MSDVIQTAQQDFDKMLPVLDVVNSLAESVAGDIYRKVAGTVEMMQTWTSAHPEVVSGAKMIAALVPGASVIVPGIDFAFHILGALGKLMSADATVQGPQPPSVPVPIAAAT